MTNFIGGPGGEIAHADMFPGVVLSERAFALAQETNVLNIVPNLREMEAVSKLTGIEYIPDITIAREYTTSRKPAEFDPKLHEVPDDYPFFPAGRLIKPNLAPVTAGDLRRFRDAGKKIIEVTVDATFENLSESYARNVEYSRGSGLFGGIVAENATDLTRAVRFLSGGKINVHSPREMRIQAAAQHKPYTVTYRPGTDVQTRP